MTDTEKADREWHLDKRVPVALILALALQGAGGIWWAASTSERLDQVERRLEGFSRRTQDMQEQVRNQGQTIAVLLSRIDDTNTNLDRVRGEIATTNDLLREMLQDRR